MDPQLNTCPCQKTSPVLEPDTSRQETERFLTLIGETARNLAYAAEVYRVAAGLHDFIQRNAGDNADWPVAITAQDEATSKQLVERLQSLHLVLMLGKTDPRYHAFLAQFGVLPKNPDAKVDVPAPVE